MNALASDTGRESPSSNVDDLNPWIGLTSFTEETRGYFYGREEEIAELARRVQRKLLTVLFGQSGLGKTSILRAGLVPRLRGHGYCPVYVRVDYSRESPEPAEQIKMAIASSARRSGEWTRQGVAADGESLWEFLHHRDDVLLDEAGKTLIPLLIFDQFEEVFTVAQTDEFGRARAARFIADLADLVENRPPAALEARIEADDATAERFDFARSDYRVLIALREDYLAPLESLKTVMPSVTQNRLRLARMTGTQGLEAVLRPGKRLVTEEVAAAIVRFVAGGAELQNAEVEPSLLSLICRELNDTRIAQGRAEISLDLLAGSHATILSNFYERALADQPPAVRRIVEDELLTDSGFRENVAEERLRRSFANAGAAPESLALLVNRRLLRIEERLDVRRVELTHDVLCGVVKSSRDVRHEREAREETERLLSQQRERETAARRALVKARQVAAVCILLAIGAVAAAILAFWSTQRAQRAEAVAQQSRVQAEDLLSYLTNDFADEFESFGRSDLVADLARREMEYFHALPEELKGTSTVRSGAIAMTQFALASRALGDLEAASAAVTEAEHLLEGLRQKGDASPATTLALARALDALALVLNLKNDGSALALSQRAVDLVAPLARANDAPRAVREAEVTLLVRLGYQLQANSNDFGKSIGLLQRAMRLAAGLGAKDLTSIRMAKQYVVAAQWIVQASSIAGQGELARSVGADGSALAEKILAVRPSDVRMMRSLSIIRINLAGLALDEMRPAEALEQSRDAVEVEAKWIAYDPGNTVSKGNLAMYRAALSDAAWALGRPRQALQYEQQALQEIAGAALGPGVRLDRIRLWADYAFRLMQTGDFKTASDASEEIGREAAELHASEPKDSLVPLWADGLKAYVDGQTALVRGDAPAASQITRRVLDRIDSAKPGAGPDQMWKGLLEYFLYEVKGRAEFLLGDHAGSERSARASLDAHQKSFPQGANYDQRQLDEQSTLIALALVAQKREAEARRLLEPVIERRRGAQSRNQGDNDVQLALASALYVQALADAPNRAVLLEESGALLDALTSDFKKLHYVQVWRRRVSDATRGVPLPPGRGGD